MVAVKTEKFLPGLFLLIFTIFVNGCFNKQSHGIQAPEPPSYGVRLIILNIDTSVPVLNAKVIMSSSPNYLLFDTERMFVTSYSDSTGIYPFEKMVPGKWDVFIYDEECLITIFPIMVVNQDTSIIVKIPRPLISGVKYKRPGNIKDKWFKTGICWQQRSVCATLGTWKTSRESKQNYTRLFEGNFEDGFEVVGNKIFDNENPELSGLVWVPPNYYSFTGGLANPQLCLLDQKTGQIVGRGRAPHRLIDLAWDGHYFWGTATNSQILKISPYSFTLVDSYPSPAAYPGGIAWDGQHIWTYDQKTRWVYEHDAEMNVIRTFCLAYQDEFYQNSTLSDIKYMAFDFDKNLWILEPIDYAIYKFKIPIN